ncbi:unnamed protein product [Pseudo-nitzschia multistriata]|uniref:Uncharacterized protein n=1 Tax=Pseudo-nitzschia multistriata TaxID=183589 RepID=A0A448ZPP1_9STRA|nr:unnamed protein product [Pseudo-nitzschia multistriata]
MGSAPSGRPTRRTPTSLWNADSRSTLTGLYGINCTVSPGTKKSAHSDLLPSFELLDSSVVSPRQRAPEAASLPLVLLLLVGSEDRRVQYNSPPLLPASPPPTSEANFSEDLLPVFFLSPVSVSGVGSDPEVGTTFHVSIGAGIDPPDHGRLAGPVFSVDPIADARVRDSSVQEDRSIEELFANRLVDGIVVSADSVRASCCDTLRRQKR